MIRYVIAFVSVVLAFPAWAEINVKEVTSPGGIKAWLVEEPSIPFVAVELRFRGGTSLDAQGKRGATNLMVGLLEEGAGDLDAQGFARESETSCSSARQSSFGSPPFGFYRHLASACRSSYKMCI